MFFTSYLLPIASPNLVDTSIIITGCILCLGVILFPGIFPVLYVGPRQWWNQRYRGLLFAAFAYEAFVLSLMLRHFFALSKSNYILANNIVVVVQYCFLFLTFLFLWFAENEKSVGKNNNSFLVYSQDLSLFFLGVSIVLFFLTWNNLYVRLIEALVGYLLFLSLLRFNKPIYALFGRYWRVALILLMATMVGYTLVWSVTAIPFGLSIETFVGFISIVLGAMGFSEWRRLISETDHLRKLPVDNDFVAEQLVALGFTKTEEKILRLLMEGSSTKEIAIALQSSEKTIRNHISSMYRKAEVRNRVELLLVFIPA